MSSTKVNQAVADCPVPGSYTLWLFKHKEYNYINAYNLGLMAKLAYSNLDLDMNSPAPDGLRDYMTILENPQQSTRRPGKIYIRDFEGDGLYLSTHILKKTRPGEGLRDPVSIQDAATSTEAFMVHDEQSLVIAVRGTQQLLKDGWTDADANQVDFVAGSFIGKGQVHNGFLTQTKVLISSINFQKYLEEHASGKTIYITGHSLGGAVATLIAAYLKDEQRIDPILYTYGSPRVGNENFVKSYANITHYRHVNRTDGVPSVPGRWMDAGHNQIGASLVFSLRSGLAGAGFFVASLFNYEGPGYYHHGNLMQITDLGRSTVMAPFQSHSITMQGVFTAAQQTETKISNIRKKYQRSLQQLDQEIEKLARRTVPEIRADFATVKMLITTQGILFRYIYTSLFDQGLDDVSMKRLELLKSQRDQLEYRYQQELQPYIKQKQELLPEEDRAIQHTLGLSSGSDHSMNNYLDFLSAEIQRIYSIYESSGCLATAESKCASVPLLRYNMALKKLTTYQKELNIYEKLYKKDIEHHRKQHNHAYYQTVLNLYLDIVRELRRVNADKKLLDELFTNFQNGSKGLYNLPIDKIEISEQIEEM